MTIQHRKTFEAMPPAGFDGVFEWDFLLECFQPTKIAPMDFDAVVERHGRFLAFETKTPGTPIPAGQRFTIERTLELGHWTWLILEGKTADTLQAVTVLTRGNLLEAGKRFEPCSAARLRLYVRRWFIRANGNQDPDPETTRRLERENNPGDEPRTLTQRDLDESWARWLADTQATD